MILAIMVGSRVHAFFNCFRNPTKMVEIVHFTRSLHEFTTFHGSCEFPYVSISWINAVSPGVRWCRPWRATMPQSWPTALRVQARHTPWKAVSRPWWRRDISDGENPGERCGFLGPTYRGIPWYTQMFPWSNSWKITMLKKEQHVEWVLLI